MTSFSETVSASERALYRRVVQRSGKHGLNANKREALSYLINLWFHHRAKGWFDPGYEAIARKLRLSVKTVKRIVQSFISEGFLRKIGGGIGRGCKTIFAIDLERIRDTLAPSSVTEIEGELARVEPEKRGQNVPPIYNDNLDSVAITPSVSLVSRYALPRRVVGLGFLRALAQRLRDPAGKTTHLGRLNPHAYPASWRLA